MDICSRIGDRTSPQIDCLGDNRQIALVGSGATRVLAAVKRQQLLARLDVLRCWVTQSRTEFWSGGVQIITKPFAIDALGDKIRKMLDSSDGRRVGGLRSPARSIQLVQVIARLKAPLDRSFGGSSSPPFCKSSFVAIVREFLFSRPGWQ
jgi:hypothetical protein